MSTLNEYLVQKREAVLAKQAKVSAQPDLQANVYKANVRAAGRSGVREIRIRDYQVISDSPEDYAGYQLGPGSPELQLGVLGSCLIHITLIQASLQELSLDSLSVEVTGELHPLAGKPGYEHIPVYPHNIRYTLDIVSTESAETIAALHQEVERVCPIFNLLTQPQHITGEVILRSP